MIVAREFLRHVFLLRTCFSPPSLSLSLDSFFPRISKTNGRVLVGRGERCYYTSRICDRCGRANGRKARSRGSSPGVWIQVISCWLPTSGGSDTAPRQRTFFRLTLSAFSNLRNSTRKTAPRSRRYRRRRTTAKEKRKKEKKRNRKERKSDNRLLGEAFSARYDCHSALSARQRDDEKTRRVVVPPPLYNFSPLVCGTYSMAAFSPRTPAKAEGIPRR